MAISDRELALRLQLKNDFQAYAAACLKIRSKSGAMVPMIMNKAQLYIHSIAERQRAEKGRVRIITVKGRQQGCSTYIEGRFYWQTTHRRGVKAFILTHEQEATNNLFEMAQRFHDNCPPLMKPSTGVNNANELNFDQLDSGYKIGTAGNKAVGRSATIQLLHNSESAYQANAESHAAGLMQAVPLAEGTEIWVESTANGENDYFHQQWKLAVAGQSEFIPVFLPWFWQDEYVVPVAEDFQPAPDEQELMVIYGLTHEQLAWRRIKIGELGGNELGVVRFKKEYPCSADEAFETSVENKVMPAALVRAAVNRPVVPMTKFRPIWGVDVGGEGATADRSALSKRMANVLLEPTKWWQGKDTMQLVGLIRLEWEATDRLMRPAKICIDSIGIGAGVVSRLKEYNDMQGVIEGINVSETKSVGDLCHRMRDELWWRAREWFYSLQVALPEGCDPLIQELTTPLWSPNSSGRVVVESKDEMKKRGIRSTDLADSFNLTFGTSEVSYEHYRENNRPQQVQVHYNPMADSHIRKDLYEAAGRR